jgi:hypothetical protein
VSGNTTVRFGSSSASSASTLSRRYAASRQQFGVHQIVHDAPAGVEQRQLAEK